MSEWISVKDRVPSGWIWNEEEHNKEPEEYIVFLKNASIPTVGMFDGEKFIPSIYSHTVKFGSEVTHWMPLPEPPEDEP